MTAFARRLLQEFEVRRSKNPRYSLRAFGRALGTTHATLGQVFRGTRPVPVTRIADWALRLGLEREEAQAYILEANAPDEVSLKRQQHLRQWSAEALAVVDDSTHFRILSLLRTGDARSDSRCIAAALGVGVDQVNISLQRLLRLKLIQMPAGSGWRDDTGLAELNENAFRRLALSRVRSLAAPRQRKGVAWGLQ